MRRSMVFLGVPLLGALLAVGCDAVQDPPRLTAQAPVLADLRVVPGDTVAFEALGAEAVQGDSVRLPLALAFEADDADGDLATISYAVLAPFERTLRDQGTMPAQAGTVQADALLTLQRGEIGTYPILVTATDQSGLVSNQLRGQVVFTSENLGPPVLSNPTADVSAPFVSNDVEFFNLVMAVDVADPDGLD